MVKNKKWGNPRSILQTGTLLIVQNENLSNWVPLEPQENVLSGHILNLARSLKPRQLRDKMCENHENRKISFWPEAITKCLQKPLQGD